MTCTVRKQPALVCSLDKCKRGKWHVPSTKTYVPCIALAKFSVLQCDAVCHVHKDWSGKHSLVPSFSHPAITDSSTKSKIGEPGTVSRHKQKH